MKRLLALLAGGLGLGALLRHRKPAPELGSSPADELRLRLAETRTEPGDVPGDEVAPPAEEPADAAARRAAVHARARNAIDELRD